MPHFGIQNCVEPCDHGAFERLELAHLFSLRRPDGWPVIGADQFIEDLIDGTLSESGLDADKIRDFVAGHSLSYCDTLVLGCRVSHAYRIVIGAAPPCASIAWPSEMVAHPDWLWALPGKQWAHPEITIFDREGRHYCGPPFSASRRTPVRERSAPLPA